MLMAGSVVASATAFRVALGGFELLAQRTPPLVGQAVTASLAGDDAAKAQARLRDSFIALARESAEISWRELRRELDDFAAFTRPCDEAGTRPQRPVRVKL